MERNAECQIRFESFDIIVDIKAIFGRNERYSSCILSGMGETQSER